MKTYLPLVLAALAVACDDPKPVVADAGTKPVVTASASAPPLDAGPAVTAERPVPKPETWVGQNAPEETQMKAMAYMVAMRAPRPGDANVDEAYATDLMNKLKPISLSMDKGPDKPKWNRTEIIAQGRQIDLYMSENCDARMPFTAVVQRANVPLAILAAHGVFVIKCNDTKRQCLQSTRDPDDVLCTTGTRHR